MAYCADATAAVLEVRRHACQPFRIVSMRYGANAAIRIGETVVQFMTFRHTPREPGWSGK